MKNTRLIILLVAFTWLAACGNKGDLIRPGTPAFERATAPASSSSAPAPAQSAAPAAASSVAPASARS